MRVLVTGGRTFDDRDWLWAGLDLIHSMQPITEIVEGGAPGADVRAQEWGTRRGIKVTTVPADWDRYGRGAGYIRNTAMALLMPDYVLACPGGKGTQSMIDIATRMGLKVVHLEKMPVARKGGRTGPPPEIVIDA